MPLQTTPVSDEKLDLIDKAAFQAALALLKVDGEQGRSLTCDLATCSDEELILFADLLRNNARALT